MEIKPGYKRVVGRGVSLGFVLVPVSSETESLSLSAVAC